MTKSKGGSESCNVAPSQDLWRLRVGQICSVALNNTMPWLIHGARHLFSNFFLAKNSSLDVEEKRNVVVCRCADCLARFIIFFYFDSNSLILCLLLFFLNIRKIPFYEKRRSSRSYSTFLSQISFSYHSSRTECNLLLLYFSNKRKCRFIVSSRPLF